MNYSIYGADRATHVKIVVVALLCATAVAGVAVGARVSSVTKEASVARLQGAPVINASRPVTVTVRDGVSIIR
ncbi:MAG: hypothetical protein ACLPKB_19890 [Xanthobacteraceae bacterium]